MKGIDWVTGPDQIPIGTRDSQWQEDIDQLVTFRSYSLDERTYLRAANFVKLLNIKDTVKELPWKGKDKFQIDINFLEGVLALKEMDTFKDKKVLNELENGFKVTGASVKAGYWKKKQIADIDELACKDTNQMLKKRKLSEKPWSFMTSDTLDKLYQKVKAEEATGRYVQIPLQEVEDDEVILDIFGVLQDTKVRKVVNGKPVNEKCSLQETAVLPNINRVIQKLVVATADKQVLTNNPDILHHNTKHEVLSQLKKEIATAKKEELPEEDNYTGPGYWFRNKLPEDIVPIEGNGGYLLGSEDLSDAFRYVPLADDDTIVIRAWDGYRWRYFRSYAMVMGCMNSVNNFQRVTNMLSVMLYNILLIPNQFYLDDIIYMVPAKELEQVSYMVKKLIEMIGFKLSNKSQIGNLITNVLGFQILSLPTSVNNVNYNVNITAAKKQKIRDKVKLLEKEKDPDNFFKILETIIGYLGFVRLVMDKRIDPLTAGIYSLWSTKNRYQMLKQVKYRKLAVETIKEMEKLLYSCNGIDIGTSAVAKEKVTIYTDATMHQGGYLILDKDGKVIKAATTKFSLFKGYLQKLWDNHIKDNTIRDWELLVVVLALLDNERFIRHKEIVLISDNTEVIWGLHQIKFKSYRNRSMLFFLKMLNMVNSICDGNDIDISYRYVNTHRNPADALTRDELLDSLKEKFEIDKVKKVKRLTFCRIGRFLGSPINQIPVEFMLPWRDF